MTEDKSLSDRVNENLKKLKCPNFGKRPYKECKSCYGYGTFIVGHKFVMCEKYLKYQDENNNSGLTDN